MTLAPDKSRIILGGRFDNLNGHQRLGLGGVDLTTGEVTSWPNRLPIADYLLNADVTSLSADANYVYGTGYNFNTAGGEGNFEGRFALNADTGQILWPDDCHGDKLQRGSGRQCPVFSRAVPQLCDGERLSRNRSPHLAPGDSRYDLSDWNPRTQHPGRLCRLCR
jgi:hypothetical protein